MVTYVGMCFYSVIRVSSQKYDAAEGINLNN